MQRLSEPPPSKSESRYPYRTNNNVCRKGLSSSSGHGALISEMQARMCGHLPSKCPISASILIYAFLSCLDAGWIRGRLQIGG